VELNLKFHKHRSLAGRSSRIVRKPHGWSGSPQRIDYVERAGACERRQPYFGPVDNLQLLGLFSGG
jgi:hypothetical protein